MANQCSQAYAFTDRYSQGDIAVLAIVFCGYCTLFLLMFTERRKMKVTYAPNKTLRWFPWGFAVLLMVLYYFVDIIHVVLYQCNIISVLGGDLSAFSVTLSVLHETADMALLAVLFFYIVLHLLRHSKGFVSTLVRTGLAVLYGITLVLLLCLLIIYGLYLYGTVDSRPHVLEGVEATLRLSYSVCAIVASTLMVLSQIKLRHVEQARPLRLSIPFLVICLLLLCLDVVVETFIFDVFHYEYASAEGVFASFVIANLLELMTFAAVFTVGKTVNRIEYDVTGASIEEGQASRRVPVKSQEIN